MGGFYGSTHVRTTDCSAVLTAVDKLTRRHKINMLVGPALRGWIAVYPAGNGQDDRIARLLAKNLNADAVHVLVHDDDIFAYSAYRGGKLIDQYNSMPDYFEPVPERAKAKLRGKPEKFADWLPDPARLPQLQELLTTTSASPVIFATATLERFAEIMGLANAVTAYEYLMQDETDDIEHWDQFTHVPNLSAEEAEKAAQAAREAAAMRQLRDDGLLLLQESRPVKKREHGLAPFFCADRGGDGFLGAWANGMNKDPMPIDRYQPPWKLPPERTSIVCASSVYYMGRSPTGRYLATGHASGDWTARLWDLERQEPILEVRHQRVVMWVGFSADEREFISLGSEDGFVTPIDTKVGSPLPVRDMRVGAVHPDGTLVASDEHGRLQLVDVATRTVRKTLTIGSAQEVEARRQAMLAVRRQAYARFDELELERGFDEQVAQVDVTVQQMMNSLPKLNPNEAAKQAQQFKETLVKSIEDSRRQFAREREQVASGTIDVGGNDKVFAMAISRDGRWLCLGTMNGVRIFEWPAVLAATDYLSDPQFQYDSAPKQIARTGQGYVYALAIHDGKQCVLFGGMTGTIDCLDLKTGRSRTLLEIPGKPTLYSMCLSGNGDTLAFRVLPGFLSDHRDRKPEELQIWNVGRCGERAANERTRIR